MRVFSTLRRLATRGPSPWPVLSVYVNTRPVGAQMTTYRPFLKKRMAEELKAFKARSPEHESLAVDFARVQHYLDYDLKDETHAAAVFACYADDDMFDAVQVPVEFPDHRVTVGPLATLFPLLRMADQYRRVAVLVADTNAARLFVIALGAIEVRREVRSPIVPRTRSAGPGDPAHAQRHVDEEWKKHARQAVQALEDLARDHGAGWILLGGDEVIVPVLEAALSASAREQLLGHWPWDIRIPERDLIAQVDHQVREREAALRQERAEAVLEAAASGTGALGAEAVIDALRESRAAEVVISDAFPEDTPGWACRSCRTFAAGAPLRPCPVCGQDAVEPVPLLEELGAQALARGARVCFVEARAVPDFDARGGIGATLRFA